MSNHNKNFKNGFTLVEMLIIAPIVILMIGIFVSAIISMTGDVLSNRGANSLSYNIQYALDTIDQDVRSSGGFLATNNIVLSANQGYNDNTILGDRTNFHNNDATNGTMLILNTYATTGNPIVSTSVQNIMHMSGQPYSCSDDTLKVNQNPPVMLNVVYFVRGGTLWRRVITPSNFETIGCNGKGIAGGAVAPPWQQPSCTVIIANTTCKAQDKRLVDGISSINIKYYSSNSSGVENTIASTGSTDNVRQAAMQTSSTVSVAINATSNTAGRSVNQSGTIRSVSPNNNTTATADTGWSSFSLNPGWSDYGRNHNTNGYRRTSYGIVTLKGLVQRTSGSNTVIGTLPSSYWPAEKLSFQTSTNPNIQSDIDIDTNGDVIMVSGSGTWISLAGINFIPKNSPYTFTNLTTIPANLWVNYSSPYATPAYTIDAAGRVYIKGQVTNGIIANTTPIINLPAEAHPSEYHTISNTANNGSYVFGFIGINSNGNIESKGSGTNLATRLSLQSIFYPYTNTNWINLTTINSWVTYGSPYTTPQYTKSSDGLVSLKGLVKSGNTAGLEADNTNVIATLPAGYRPAMRALYCVSSNNNYSRIDIDNSGNIRYITGSNVWLSLDGITFYADQ